MNRLVKSRVLVLLAVPALLLLAACSKPVDLRMQFAAGDRHEYDLVNELQMEMMGQNVPQRSTQTLVYEITEVSPDNVATVKSTMDLEGMMGMGDAMAQGADEILGEVGQLELSYQMTPKGDISNVQGVDAFVNKITEVSKKAMEDQMSALTPEQKKAMEGMGGAFSPDKMMEQMTGVFKKMFSPETMEKMLEQNMHFYPPQPVKVGDTWTGSYEMGMPMPAKVDSSYTVVSRNSGSVAVSYKSTISPLPGGVFEMGPMKIEMKTSGTVDGTVEIDEASGWLKASSADVNMQTDVMGMTTKVSGKTYIQPK